MPNTNSNCLWHTQTPALKHYHDHEWGFPTKNPFQLFEKISLESLQAGLSWRTVLEKRSAFRQCFDQFNYHKIAQYDSEKIKSLLKNPAIIRHQKKILAIVHNAKIAAQIEKEYGSFSKFIWQSPPPSSQQPYRAPPDEAQQLVKRLKTHQWKFIGITTGYAFMQAAGLINDHDKNCPVRKTILQLNNNP